MIIFDRDRLNRQSLQLAQNSAGDRQTRPVAQRRTATALRTAAVLLGLHGRVPTGGALGRGTARWAEPLPPRLQEAAALRADLLQALAGALNFAAGREGKGSSGPDNEDDAANTIALLLAVGNACHDAAARLQALGGAPDEDPAR